MRTRFNSLALVFLVWFGAASAAWAQLPEGAGKDLLIKICGNCHGADVVTGYSQTKEGWTDTISKMIEQGAEGTDEQFNTILAYLVKNFGPAAPAPINVNKATAAEMQTQLELTEKEAAAIVSYRTDKGAYKAIDDLKKVPDLDYKKIEAKKDRIVFQ